MSTIAKDRSRFVEHGPSLEFPVETLYGYLTPADKFFVCNSGTTPRIRSAEYALRLWGDGVSRECVLSCDELCTLPQRTVPALLKCAVNNRAFFRDVQGETLDKRPGTTELIWSTGAVGMADWSGVSLANVLAKAGVTPDAIQVCPTGSESDSCGRVIRMPLPIDKAMDVDTLVALSMNGEPLPGDHGYPVRLLVPGWVGAYSVKWVQEIEVSTQPIWVRRNTETYVMEGDSWPADQYSPSRGKRITVLNIKSTLALHWPALVSAGAQNFYGYARSPGTRISTVEWSDDSGKSWSKAELIGQNEPYGWVRFEINWTARKGERVLMTRATDGAGDRQPMSIPFNAGG